MPLYIYRCASGHETELLRNREVMEERCSCGNPAQRQMFYAVPALESTRKAKARPNVPPSKYRLSDFKEAQAEVQYNYQRAGQQPPDLLAAGVAKGKRHKAAGVRP